MRSSLVGVLVQSDAGDVFSINLPVHSTVNLLKEEVAKLAGASVSLIVHDNEPVFDESMTLESFVIDNKSLSFRVFVDGDGRKKRFEALLLQLKNNDASVVDVNARGMGLGMEETKQLVDALKSNDHATSVFLDENSIGDEGCMLVANLLEQKHTIHTVSLCDNGIGDKGCIRLAAALKDNNAIVSLSLERNHITKVGTKVLAEAIQSEHSILNYVVVDRDAMSEELSQLLNDGFQVVKNDQKLGDSLMSAVSRGDVAAISKEKNLIAVRMGLFGTYRQGLIHQAAATGHLKVVQFMVANLGVDVDFRSGFGRTALHEATQSRSKDVIEFLVQRGADIDALDDEGNTPLTLACNDDFEIAKLLVQHGAAIDVPNQHGHTPLDSLSSVEASALRKLSSSVRNFARDLKREADKWFRTRSKMTIERSVELSPGLQKALHGSLDMLASHPIAEDEPHRQLVLAIGFLSHPKLFEPEDVDHALSMYEKDRTSVSPLLLLAHSRAKSVNHDENSTMSRVFLLREFLQHWPLGEQFLTNEEKNLVNTKVQLSTSIASNPEISLLEKLRQEWEHVSSSLTTEQRDPMEKLMSMVGLVAVKRIALSLYRSMLRDRDLVKQGKKDAIIPKVLNFAFVGNPGSGKTVTAELFAHLLEQSGARSGHRFIQMTASQALQKGAKAFSAELESLTGGKKGVEPPPRPLRRNMTVEVECGANKKLYPGIINSIDKKKGLYEIKYSGGTIEEDVEESRIFALGEKDKIGGVLFIDEAYDLDPANNREGKLILADIMQAAEEHRDTISIILAGYQDDIEKKLYSFNSGMASRFQTVPFEDFSEVELREIWVSLCSKHKWDVERKATSVAVARIARGRNLKGFGNARSVRKAFLTIAGSAAKPGQIVVEDVIGQRPNRRLNPELDAAMSELDSLTGQSKVKEAISKLVKQAELNYDRELKGLRVVDIGLNRLFLGNPGTGKTTVATIYGKVLKALRLLSNGEVLCKTASDFVGDVVGASQTRTKALIEAAQGKVLLIDEAYVLDDSMYGKQALDTIVEKVQGAPGEDIAVVMIGYKPQMLKMLREQNPGLSRRFQPANAFEFEDFTDEELLETFVSYCKKDSVYAPPEVKALAVKVLRQQRTLPNFGNAGAVKNLLSQAKQNALCRLGDNTLAEKLVLEPKDLQPDLKGISEQDEALKILQGYGSIEQKMRELGLMIQVRNREGRPLDGIVSNFVFYGAPGTGKTTVARQIAKLLHNYGVLATDQLIETSGAALTGSFVGKAKEIVREKMEAARGGVLFIDEAYQMGDGSYGREAVAQFVEMLTTEHFIGGKTVVILAGYKHDIDSMMSTNEGLKSRFETWVHFENWNGEKSADFVLEQASNNGFAFENVKRAKIILTNAFKELIERPGWGNGRDATTMYKKVLRQRDLRVAKDHGAPKAIIIENTDIEQAAEEFLASRSKDIAVDMKQVLSSYPSLLEQKVESVGPRPLKRLHHQPDTGLSSSFPSKNSDADAPLLDVQDQEQQAGSWNGLDIEGELRPINNVVQSWAKEKLDQLRDGSSEVKNEVLKGLIKNGMNQDEARRIAQKYVQALDELRRIEHAARERAKLLNRKPIIQCQVCKRTGNFWAPCWVAPMQIGWESVEMETFKEIE